MEQLSFASLDYAAKKKRTKRDVLLVEMAAVRPWVGSKLCCGARRKLKRPSLSISLFSWLSEACPAVRSAHRAFPLHDGKFRSPAMAQMIRNQHLKLGHFKYYLYLKYFIDAPRESLNNLTIVAGGHRRSRGCLEIAAREKVALAATEIGLQLRCCEQLPRQA